MIRLTIATAASINQFIYVMLSRILQTLLFENKDTCKTPRLHVISTLKDYLLLAQNQVPVLTPYQKISSLKFYRLALVKAHL